jgi:malonyl-CoA O-methyltransferase
VIGATLNTGTRGDEESERFALDMRSVRRSFDRAAGGYDAAAVLQSAVREVLLERLDLTRLAPRFVLDAGAGTGRASRALKERYPRARVIAVDFALGMLRTAKRRQSWLCRFDRVQADAERLPFGDASIDLIFSNLLLPWCDPDRLFAEFRRVLAPNGLLTCSGLGPDTLRELRVAWAQVDAHRHVNQFIDMHDLGDALVRAGFAAPVLDVDRYTLKYKDFRALALDLKALGTRNFTAARQRGLTAKGKLIEMQNAYEAFREHDHLPATAEVVFAHAWAGGELPRRRADGASISLAELRRKLPGNRRP